MIYTDDNDDSYTGPKCHNFDLYERDGKLSVFPWDYNLAFGAFLLDGHFGHCIINVIGTHPDTAIRE